VSRPRRLDRLLQSDFVTPPEPSTHSDRRIAFGVSPHHFAPVFNRKRVNGSGNSTLKCSTDVEDFSLASDGGRGVLL